ncbi:cobalamin biosynthesis protein [Azospirillum thermophilum]|nr:cobalamin biosynthesis protein [Azospirillum thermophilum]
MMAAGIFAGIGCRTGCGGEEIAGLLTACLDEAAVPAEARAAVRMAAPDRKRTEAGIAEAAGRLGLALVFVPQAELAAVQDRVATRSAAVRTAVGLDSVAEAAALAAAGPGSRLLLPRRATARATCALAISGDMP